MITLLRACAQPEPGGSVPGGAGGVGCVRAELLDAAVRAGEIRADVDAHAFMCGVGGLCAGAGGNARYDARRLVEVLVAGLRRSSR